MMKYRARAHIINLKNPERCLCFMETRKAKVSVHPEINERLLLDLLRENRDADVVCYNCLKAFHAKPIR